MNIYVVPGTELEPVVRDGRGQFAVIFLSHITTDQLQNLRCLNCGWIICQYSDKEISAVVCGTSVPKDKTTLDIQCQRCHFLYRVV